MSKVVYYHRNWPNNLLQLIIRIDLTINDHYNSNHGVSSSEINFGDIFDDENILTEEYPSVMKLMDLHMGDLNGNFIKYVLFFVINIC